MTLSTLLYGPIHKIDIELNPSYGPSEDNAYLEATGFLDEQRSYSFFVGACGESCSSGANGSANASGNAWGSLYLTPLGTRLVALEIIQSLGQWDSTIPLVSGKPTYVRAYVEPVSAAFVPIMNPKLRGFDSEGRELPGSPLIPISRSAKEARPGAALPAQRAQWDGSVNFQLPAYWTTNSIRLEFNMTGLQAGPGGSQRWISFNPSPRLDLKLVRLILQRAGQTNQTPVFTGSMDIVQELVPIYPINASSLHFSEETMVVYSADPAGVTAEEVLEQVALKKIEDKSAAIYAAMMDRTMLDGLDGLSVNIPGDVVVANVFRHWAMAHELAHALGEFHTVNTQQFGVISLSLDEADPAFLPETNYACGPCGMIAPLSRAVPFPFFEGEYARLGPMDKGTNLLVYGLDTSHGALRVLSPYSSVDLMQPYCHGTNDWWISSFTYNRLLSALYSRSRTSPLAEKRASSGGPAQPYVLLRGLINLTNHQVRWLPSRALLTDSPPTWPSGTTHRLDVYARDQGLTNLVLSRPFAPSLARADTGAATPGAGFFHLPVPGALSNLVRVEIRGPTNLIASRQRSPNAPVIYLSSTAGGRVSATNSLLARWNAADADGDPLVYHLQYSSDGGQVWQTLANDWPDTEFLLTHDCLPGGANLLVKVTASDGMNQAESQSSAPFAVENHAPLIRMVRPSPNEHLIGDSFVRFEVQARDAEDGPLPNDRVIWTSNRDGFLGEGLVFETRATQLSEGDHWITATATDTAGATSHDARPIKISRYAAPSLQKITRLAEDTLWMSAVGDVSGSQVLEVSTNLLEWTPVATNLNSSGFYDFLRKVNPAAAAEFFRVRTQP